MADGPDSIFDSYRAGIIRKTALLIGSVIGVVLVVGLLSVSVCDSISVTEAYRLIWNHICGVEYPLRSEDWWNDRTIWNGAVPRALAAILAGMGLAAAGTMMQALMNNPLADPYSTGISSGACFGAVSAIVVGVSYGSVAGDSATVFSAFIGAMIPALIIIIISTRILLTPATLILMGTAISYFFNSMVTYLMVSTDADTLQNAYLWQIGSLDNIMWSQVPIMAFVTISGVICVLSFSKKLNILSLGDASAKSLGLDVETFRTVCLMIMAVMTAGIVSFTGILGFVGLVTPHIVRVLVGADNKFVTPISMSFAAFMMLFADYLGMTWMNVQVGAIVSMIGSPIFFILIVYQKRGREVF